MTAAPNTAVLPVSVTRRGLFRRLAGASTTEALRPPFAVAEAAFTDLCTRCGDCATACPPGIIVMAGGFPEVNFQQSGCDFCGDCARACRDGALVPVAGTGWRHAVAVADACLAAQGVVCRVCGEQCEAGAIRFRPAVGGRAAPVVDPAACTGCGACIAPCPAGAVSVAFA